MNFRMWALLSTDLWRTTVSRWTTRVDMKRWQLCLYITSHFFSSLCLHRNMSSSSSLCLSLALTPTNSLLLYHLLYPRLYGRWGKRKREKAKKKKKPPNPLTRPSSSFFFFFFFESLSLWSCREQLQCLQPRPGLLSSGEVWNLTDPIHALPGLCLCSCYIIRGNAATGECELFSEGGEEEEEGNSGRRRAQRGFGSNQQEAI